MKNLRPFSAVPRFPFARSLVLSVGLLLLAAGPAGAVSMDEQRLFDVAGDDNNGHNAVRTLLAKGVSPNVPVEFSALRRAAIHVAAEKGAIKNLAAMLKASGNPTLPDGEGNTPLHWASTGSRGGMGLTHNHPAAIRLLVQHGADLHRTNHNGATPLHVAVYIGLGRGSAGIDVIKALLDAGAKPERTDGEGLTAVQRFARYGENQGAIVTVLLKAGADPNRVTPGGDTPLHLAVREGSGKPAVVKALLAGGAEPCLQDADGYTPYQLSNVQENAVIRQALDLAQGHDLACNNKKQAGDPQRAEGGATTGDDTGEEKAGQAPAMEPFGPNWIVAENQPCQRFNPNPTPGETYTWSGGCVDGKVSGTGRGVWHLPDGGQQVEEGSWRDGKSHGYGTLTLADGNRYEGNWREDKPHGYGTFTLADGNRYEGQWHNGCFRREDGAMAWVGTSKGACGFD